VREGIRRRAVNLRGGVVEEFGGESRLLKCGIMSRMSVGLESVSVGQRGWQGILHC
jgi:hypothetical protein